MNNQIQELFLSSIFREEPYKAISSGEDLSKRETFNSRMRPLVSRMNEIARNMASISMGDPRFLAELFRFNANPVFEKSFTYENIDSYRYSSFFDNEGQITGLPDDVIILAMNEAGRLPESEFEFMMFDKEGLLIKDSEYYVRNTQDGCNVFFRIKNSVTGEVQIADNETLTVLAMRKFYTPSQPQRFLKTLTAEDIGGTFEATFEGTVESPLGPMVDTRYVKLYYKPVGTGHFMMYPDDKYEVILNADGEAKLSVDLTIGNSEGDQLCAVNALEWNCLDFNYSLNESLEFNILSEGSKNTFDISLVNGGDLAFIPLINIINSTRFPTGITTARDIHLWIDKMHLTPDVDYTIQFKNNIGFGIYLPKELMLGDNVHVYAVANEPYVAEMVYEHREELPENMALKLTRDVAYLLNGGGLTFANNRFVSNERLTPISERHVVLEKTCSRLNAEVRMSFLATKALVETLKLFESYGSEFSRLMALSPSFEENFLTKTYADTLFRICTHNPMQLGYSARAAFGGMRINNNAVAMLEDTTLSGSFIINDPELNVVYELVTDASNGVLSFDAGGTFSYTPMSNWFGTDTIEVKVTEAITGIERVQSVAFVVQNVDDATVLTTTAFSVDEDSVLSSQLYYVDIDSNQIAFSVKRQPSHGTLVLNPLTGAFIYTPNSNFFGSDSFEVFMTDEGDNSSRGTVNLTVNPINDAPYITNTTFNTVEDGSLVDTLLMSDVEGDVTVVSLVSSGANGDAVVQANGTFTYTPDAGFSGVDQFVVEVEDAQGAKRTHTITVNVNDLPVLNTVSFSMNEDEVLQTSLNASDSDGLVSFTIHTQPDNGSAVTLTPTGAINFTPAANFNGLSKFTVTMTDVHGATRDAEVTVSVQAVNDDPSVIVKQFDAILNLQLDGQLTFHDVDGDSVASVLSTQATNGTATVQPDGSFTYVPNPDYRGEDTFFVTISDGKGGTVVEPIAVTVDTTPMFDYFVNNAEMVDNNGNIDVDANIDTVSDFELDSNADLPAEYDGDVILNGNEDPTLSTDYYLYGNGQEPAPQ